MDDDGPIANYLDRSTVERAEDFRRRRETAILAIAFTDIADSTALRERQGEIAYEEQREEHDEEVRRLVEIDEAGKIVKSTGDGALIVFAEPSTAVERLCELQQQMIGHPLFRLKVGLDMGQVSVRRSGVTLDVFGRHVNRAARIQAEARPGHILTSGVVFDAAENWLKGSSIEWVHLGDMKLKGFTSEISVIEAYDSRYWLPQVHTPSPLVSDFDEEQELPRMRDGVAVLYSRNMDLSNSEIDGRAFREEWPRYLGETIAERAMADENDLAAPLSNLEVIPRGDPYDDLARQIKWKASSYRGRSGQPFLIYWIDDFPKNNERLTKLLRRSEVKVIQVRNDQELDNKIANMPPNLLITDMGRGGDPAAGLATLLRWHQRSNNWPRIVYTTGRAAGHFGEQCYEAGAALVTSGALTVLYAVQQTIDRYLKVRS